MTTANKVILNRINTQLNTITQDLISLTSDEQEAYDNMSENAQDGEKGCQLVDNIDGLDNSVNEIQSVIDTLSSIE